MWRSVMLGVLAAAVAACAGPRQPVADDSLMVVPKHERKLGVEFGTFVGGSIGR